MYEGVTDIPNDEVISVYVVVNGSLGMSTGKIAAQVFHATRLWKDEQQAKWNDRPLLLWYGPSLKEWEAQGCRVVTRLAETEHLFNRVMEEIDGVGMQDEGLTEVPHGSWTVFITRPFTRANAPRLLHNKKIQLL
jgi:peptidyl-tRNA hydrolase